MDLTLRPLGLLVGTPQPLDDGAGGRVLSAIRKRPVDTPEVHLSLTGLDGDRQADPLSHGGPDKAVYLYPAVHYPYWESQGYALTPGGVGENVPAEGADETGVRIGDVFAWGETRVQVSQPRSPCFKLALHTRHRDMTARVIATARCGWYLRVLHPGAVPARGTLRLVERDDDAPTVAELFTGSFARGTDCDAARLRSMIETPALADQWRHGVRGKLERLGA